MPRTRWATSPRAQRLAWHGHERSIARFTRLFDALWARVGGEGCFCRVRSCPLHPSPRRFAATLSHKGSDPAARVELIEPSCHRHELASVRHEHHSQHARSNWLPPHASLSYPCRRTCPCRSLSQRRPSCHRRASIGWRSGKGRRRDAAAGGRASRPPQRRSGKGRRRDAAAPGASRLVYAAHAAASGPLEKHHSWEGTP